MIAIVVALGIMLERLLYCIHLEKTVNTTVACCPIFAKLTMVENSFIMVGLFEKLEFLSNLCIIIENFADRPLSLSRILSSLPQLNT